MGWKITVLNGANLGGPVLGSVKVLLVPGWGTLGVLLNAFCCSYKCEVPCFWNLFWFVEIWFWLETGWYLDLNSVPVSKWTLRSLRMFEFWNQVGGIFPRWLLVPSFPLLFLPPLVLCPLKFLLRVSFVSFGGVESFGDVVSSREAFSPEQFSSSDELSICWRGLFCNQIFSWLRSLSCRWISSRQSVLSCSRNSCWLWLTVRRG